MDSLAEAELDDAEDLQEAMPTELDPILRARGSVQLSSIQEPVMVRGWPMGLALASAPTITVSMTATGFQKMMSVMACLNGHCFRSGDYKVETNQFKQGVASIRAQPRVRPPSLPSRQILVILEASKVEHTSNIHKKIYMHLT